MTSLGIASVTKTFVAAEVLLLARAGKIVLDAPLAQYVRHKLTANNATVRHWTPEQALPYLSTPVGPPGTYDYSNPSYVLLGMLIENVTGQPLATVLRRDLAAANGAATADAPSIARWGYQLYGGRVLPADLVAAMTAGDGDYGLGTRRFSLRFGNAPAYGHDGNLPDHCSIVVAIPALRVAVAVLVAEGGKNAGAIAADLVTAARPLLR